MGAAKPTPPGGDLNLPEDWGRDPLSEFLSAAWRNTANTFAVDRERYDVLVELDGAFRLLIENLADSTEHLSGALLVRSHSSLLAAVSLGLSGQVAEGYTLLRTTLEAALQGLFVAGDESRQKLWRGRSDDNAARDRMLAEFTSEKMSQRLREVDAATASIYGKLYERTVEHAAHPNTYADLFGKEKGGSPGFDFKSEYFVVGDEVQKFCLRSIAQVGICCLSVFYYVFPEKYRALGLDARLIKLRQGH